MKVFYALSYNILISIVDTVTDQRLIPAIHELRKYQNSLPHLIPQNTIVMLYENLQLQVT